MQVLHRLAKYDIDCYMEMCEWFLDQIGTDDNFDKNVLFSDEANSYVNGEANKQNLQYWLPKNSHWYSGDN